MAFFDKLGEMAKSTTDKAGEKIEITRINGRIKAEQQLIEGFKTELGGKYWEKIAAHTIEPDPDAAEIVAKIRASFANIEGFENDIKKIEDDRRAADEAAKKAAEEEAARKQAAAQAAPAVVYAPPVPAERFAPEQQGAVLGGNEQAPVQGEYVFGAVSQPQPVNQAAQQPTGLKCANCGKALDPGARFCAECGAPAPKPEPAPAPAPAVRFCANCGAQLLPDARFCPECGTKA